MRQKKENKKIRNRKGDWRREELIIAFNLYCKIPFGTLHRTNPDIVDVAGRLGRTPSAVAMKLVNFASLDPVHKSRNVAGLKHASKMDRAIWDEFASDWEKLSFESQKAMAKLTPYAFKDGLDNDLDFPDVNSESEVNATLRVRLVQDFFRAAVLASYESSCSICGIGVVELLNASHIIPWHLDVARRADPTNGIALCTLHDRAFDRGLISVDQDHRILLSSRLKQAPESRILRVSVLDFEGCKIKMPSRFLPDITAIKFHRDNIFQP